MDELFDEISGVIKASNEAIQSGLVLGRAESEKRIKELEDKNEWLLEALKSARIFIKNGIELGFIRMPACNVPNPAHHTLPIIEQAITEAEG